MHECINTGLRFLPTRVSHTHRHGNFNVTSKDRSPSCINRDICPPELFMFILVSVFIHFYSFCCKRCMGELLTPGRTLPHFLRPKSRFSVITIDVDKDDRGAPNSS